MQPHSRVLRSTKREHLTTRPTPGDAGTFEPAIKLIPYGTTLPDLGRDEAKLLRQKQKRLLLNASSTLGSMPPGTGPRCALESTLIFAQYEAGTAVCIRPGWILTCAHCFGDDTEEYTTASKRRWLLSYSGLAIQAECRAWDYKRDLALMKIIAIEHGQPCPPVLPHVQLSQCASTLGESIFCIGQPGKDDLESKSIQRTKYNLIEISEGSFRGMMGGDPQENSQIGRLKHDSWTYWGHSGAPLLRAKDATLIGLHSSWDDETGMRHGVPWIAIQDFLEDYSQLLASPNETAKTESEPEVIGGTATRQLMRERNASSKTP